MPAKGQHLSLEIRRRISRWNKLYSPVRGTHLSDDVKSRISIALTGRLLSKETKAKISIARKGIKFSDETRAKMSEAFTGRQPSEEQKAKTSIAIKRICENPEVKARRSAIMKERWLDSEQARKMLSQPKPNKAEVKLQDILDRNFPHDWKFVGDGQVNLGGRFPDFINTNGKKEVIELFGAYWHDVFEIAEKKEHYRQYGFRVAVIWEDELKDEARLMKIFRRRFLS